LLPGAIDLSPDDRAGVAVVHRRLQLKLNDYLASLLLTNLRLLRKIALEDQRLINVSFLIEKEIEGSEHIALARVIEADQCCIDRKIDVQIHQRPKIGHPHTRNEHPSLIP